MRAPLNATQERSTNTILRAPSADPAHLRELMKGRDSWNEFIARARIDHPGFRPNLRGIAIGLENLEASPALVARDGMERSPYVRMNGMDLRGADLQGADLAGVHLVSADLSNANLALVNLRGANLAGANLSGADLTNAKLCSAILSSARLNRSKLHRTLLSGAFLNYANLTGARLNGADVSGASVTGVRYRRGAAMLGCYGGIKGAEAAHGDTHWRRDAIDQDFIDGKYARCRLPSPAEWQATPMRATLSMIYRLPSRGLFMLWGLWDYGRSLTRILIFAALSVLLIGAIFSAIIPSHLAYAQPWPDPLPAVAPINPWVVASIEFLTLGLSETVRPLDAYGVLALSLQVMLGLVTLILLAGVLQSKFARRL